MLEEYMMNIGYTDEQIELIINSYPLNTYTESTLLFNIKNMINFFHRNGLNNEDIIKITSTIPNLLVISTENIKNRVKELITLGFNKLEAYKMIKNYPYIIELSFQKIINKYNYLKDLGFSDDNIVDIMANKTDVICIDNTILRKIINYFTEFGFSIDDIINIINVVPEVIDLRISYINKIIDELNNYGFKKSSIIKIITTVPNLFIFKDSLTDNLDKLHELGYTIKDIISIVSRVPMVLRKSYFENITIKFALLNTYEFTNSDIAKMTIDNPYILVYSSEKIVGNIDKLINSNYSKDEAINMIKNCPLILGYDSNTLNGKLAFYKSNGLEKYICNNSHLLNFSLDLIKAREKVISDNKIDNVYYKDLFENNSCATLLIDNLFLSEEDFYNIYNLTTDDLLRRSK